MELGASQGTSQGARDFTGTSQGARDFARDFTRDFARSQGLHKGLHKRLHKCVDVELMGLLVGRGERFVHPLRKLMKRLLVFVVNVVAQRFQGVGVIQAGGHLPPLEPGNLFRDDRGQAPVVFCKRLDLHERRGRLRALARLPEPNRCGRVHWAARRDWAFQLARGAGPRCAFSRATGCAAVFFQQSHPK